MRAPPLIISCALSLSLACHLVLLVWYPHQQWLAGSSISDTPAGLMISIVADYDSKLEATEQDTLAAEPDNEDGTATGRASKVATSSASVPAMVTKQKPVAKEKPVALDKNELIATASIPTKTTIQPALVSSLAETVSRPQQNSQPTGSLPAPGKIKKSVRSIADADKDEDKSVVADSAVEPKKTTVEDAANGAARAAVKPVAMQAKRYQLGAPHTPKPKYPGIAVKRQWQGEVLIAMQVKADGTPAKVTVEKGSGYAVLDKSALRMLATWRLAPSPETLETLYIPVIFRL